MSSDRLREAADRLDAETAHRRATFGTNWERVRRDTAAAALLRAVAYLGDTLVLSETYAALSDAASDAVDDALALADAVLGTPNSDPVRTDDEQ